MDIGDELSSGEWDKMEIRSLSEEDIGEIMRDPRLTAIPFSNPPGYSYTEHAHDEPQALLLLRGELTHVSRGKRYTQHPGDLLIVPAHAPHTAMVGEEGIDCLFIQKA